jgi:hypothetical protein
MYTPPALYTKERILSDLQDVDYLGKRSVSLHLHHQLSREFKRLVKLAGSKRFLTEYANLYRLLDEYEASLVSI